MAAMAPIGPLEFRNARDVMPKHPLLLRPATVEVVVHPPVSTARWRKRDLDRNIESVRRLFEKTLAD
jgi:putative phosphoserine phosphatase/1-acylglycerol-3-phosphate O-acyltransferase